MAEAADPFDPRDRPWRVGLRNGRNIYAILGDEPSDEDPSLGYMREARWAQDAVDGHNSVLHVTKALQTFDALDESGALGGTPGEQDPDSSDRPLGRGF